MKLSEAVSFIQAASWQGSRLGLERIAELMARLGDPERDLKFVHVAGTNGKGSVAAMLAAILTAAGYRTGLYTSPHLCRYHERMQIDGVPISDGDLCAAAETVKIQADRMDDPPTEFERITAMALVYFAQKACDIVVLEVGLGGRLDATNVIPPPEAAVITNLGLEHTDVLGDTLAQIAWEKAGIVKPGCAVVSYDSAPEALEVIGAVCAERGAPLTRVRRSDLRLLSQGLEGQRFSWRDLEDLYLPLLGEHQLHNAAVALETVRVLGRGKWNIPEKAVRDGLAAARWPARLEVLSRDPLFLLDGGHNPQCAKALADSLKQLLPGQKFLFLIGVLADKDYPAIVGQMLPLAQEFICLTPDSGRALPAGELAAYLEGEGARAAACADVPSGIAAALCAADGARAVVAFGSLYLAGAVREVFHGQHRKWLRRSRIRARDALGQAERAGLSRLISERILGSPEFRQAGTVLLYRATRGEVRLEGLEADPRAAGKRLVYPLCVSGSEMIALLPRGEDAWVSGYCGIPEPDRARSQLIPPEEIDLVLCPCTAFDEGGNRMGMGAGFYDRYLPQCVNAHVAAVAFECQKARPVPTDPWDRPMELVFTERAVYRTG